MATQRPVRVPGVAIFLTGNPASVPRTLLHNFKHNKILHERIVLLTVQNEDVPRVPSADRTTQESFAHGFSRLVVRFGFSEDPDIPAVLRQLATAQPELNPMAVTYFLGRETLLVTHRPGMPVWRKRLFAFLSRNAHDASHFFRLPPTRVIEVGIQVEF